MDRLCRIADSIRVEISPEALESDKPSRILAGFYEPYEQLEPEINLDSTKALIEEIVNDFSRFDTGMDRVMLMRLHAGLPLSRRTASDRRVWAWLGLVAFPDFVAHRWRPASGREMRSSDRFVGSHVRQTFARLWWAAELTVDESGSYDLTESLTGLSGFQDVYEAIFGRSFCQYRPAIKAFVETVGSHSEGVIRSVAKEFGYLTTTLVLESMDEAAISDELKQIVEKITDD